MPFYVAIAATTKAFSWSGLALQHPFNAVRSFCLKQPGVADRYRNTAWFSPVFSNKKNELDKLLYDNYSNIYCRTPPSKKTKIDMQFITNLVGIDLSIMSYLLSACYNQNLVHFQPQSYNFNSLLATVPIHFKCSKDMIFPNIDRLSTYGDMMGYSGDPVIQDTIFCCL